jgi:SNF2 family DNA or RNA helicase
LINVSASQKVEGVEWLFSRFSNPSLGGCILADDMGLGKTLQTLTFLSLLDLTPTSSALILCPLSVANQWKEAIEQFFSTSTLKGWQYVGELIIIRETFSALFFGYSP